MPVNEFNGNDSWGYNPTFYLALDKAYGDKSTFKQLVNACHERGIAVLLLDVVLNHADYPNPFLKDVLECFVLPACCEQPVVQ